MPTLYVTEPGARLHKAEDRLVVRKGDEVLEEIPIIKVDQVVLVGRSVAVTTSALHALSRRGVEVVYLTGSGGFVSRTVGSEHKNGRLRHTQSLMVADPQFSLYVASSIVYGKVLNQHTIVQRHAEGGMWARSALSGMEAMARRVESARNLDELRGLEGQAAKEYFSLLRRLLQPPKNGGEWGFDRRAYYPPPDPINALLSFAYTLLLKDVLAACELAGLDPYLGFFHAIDYGRPSMALDLMEEFRPVVADSIVLTAVNRQMFSLEDFQVVDVDDVETYDDPDKPAPSAPQAVYLMNPARQVFIELYEARVNSSLQYPLSGETLSYRQVFQAQAYQMAQLVMNETQAYQPVLLR